MTETTVDKKTFRVNLGIFGAIIVFGFATGSWATETQGVIERALGGLTRLEAEAKETRLSMRRIETQLSESGLSRAVLETLVGNLDRRIEALERAVK